MSKLSLQGLRDIGDMLSDRKRVIVLLTWLVITVSSVPFERINDDEVIYFLEARQIITVGPFAHGDLIFVPQILGGIASGIYNSLLAARAVSAIIVLATAILIYNIKKDDATFISSMLYLTSFYTIRFGMRFYLDPYGGLFTIAAIYFLYKEKSHFVGVYSGLAVFSREMAAPLFPIFAILVYRKKMGLKKFLLGFTAIVIIGTFWIYFANKGIQSATLASSTQAPSLSFLRLISLDSVAKGWLQYFLISPLVVVGLLFARGSRGKPEFYPLVFSFLILSLVPGFWVNGAATEYPYIFNTISCLIAGVGLKTMYDKFRPKSKAIIKVAVALLIVQFAMQSYLATALTVNHTIGLQDYGYWYDQELLSYMDKHYDSGKIYSSILDGLLDPRLATNLVWDPQNMTRAMIANPPWLITYSSYVIILHIPTNTTVAFIGPYVVVHSRGIPLSSFVQLSNSTQFFS